MTYRNEPLADPSNAEFTAELAAQKKKKQLQVIAVLVLLLILALVTQPSGDVSENSSETAATTLAAQPVSLNRPTAASNAAGQTETWEFVLHEQLSSRSLAESLQNKLFDLDEPAPPPTDSVKHDAKPPMPTPVLKAVYGPANQNSRSAIIGSDVIHTGQELPTGSRVTKIDQNGVHVVGE